MDIKLHKTATTTPRIRQPALFIRTSNERFMSSGDRYRPTLMSCGRWVADQSIAFTD